MAISAENKEQVPYHLLLSVSAELQTNTKNVLRTSLNSIFRILQKDNNMKQ